MTACGFSEGAQENWLITQHINTMLPGGGGGGGERLRKVTVVFEGTLRVLKYTSGRHQSLTEMEQLTPTITSELVESLPMLLVE